jgi:hypothetical protein
MIQHANLRDILQLPSGPLKELFISPHDKFRTMNCRTVECSFEYLPLTPYTQAFAESICAYLNKKFVDGRIHKFDADDFCAVHEDTAYPYSHTIIVCLDKDEDDRLVINDTIVREYEGSVYVMPPLTSHGIAKGKSSRISFIIWANQ